METGDELEFMDFKQAGIRKVHSDSMGPNCAACSIRNFQKPNGNIYPTKIIYGSSQFPCFFSCTKQMIFSSFFQNTARISPTSPPHVKQAFCGCVYFETCTDIKAFLHKEKPVKDCLYVHICSVCFRAHSQQNI